MSSFACSRRCACRRLRRAAAPYLKRLTLFVRDGCDREHVFYPVHPPETHAGEVLGWLQAAGARTTV